MNSNQIKKRTETQPLGLGVAEEVIAKSDSGGVMEIQLGETRKSVRCSTPCVTSHVHTHSISDSWPNLPTLLSPPAPLNQSGGSSHVAEFRARLSLHLVSAALYV